MASTIVALTPELDETLSSRLYLIFRRTIGRLLAELRTETAAQAAAVFVFRDTPARLVCAAAAGYEPAFSSRQYLLHGKYLTSWVYSYGAQIVSGGKDGIITCVNMTRPRIEKMVEAGKMHYSPACAAFLEGKKDIENLLLIPIMVDAVCVGVLKLVNKADAEPDGVFPEADVAKATYLSSRIAVAFDNLRHAEFWAAAEDAEENADSRSGYLHEFLHAFCRLFQAECASIFLAGRKEDPHLLECGGAVGYKEGYSYRCSKVDEDQQTAFTSYLARKRDIQRWDEPHMLADPDLPYAGTGRLWISSGVFRNIMGCGLWASTDAQHPFGVLKIENKQPENISGFDLRDEILLDSILSIKLIPRLLTCDWKVSLGVRELENRFGASWRYSKEWHEKAAEIVRHARSSETIRESDCVRYLQISRQHFHRLFGARKALAVNQGGTP